jgi:hypothetical protein
VDRHLQECRTLFNLHQTACGVSLARSLPPDLVGNTPHSVLAKLLPLRFRRHEDGGLNHAFDEATTIGYLEHPPCTVCSILPYTKMDPTDAGAHRCCTKCQTYSTFSIDCEYCQDGLQGRADWRDRRSEKRRGMARVGSKGASKHVPEHQRDSFRRLGPESRLE